MPTALVADASLPVIARRFPLAAAYLSSLAHAGFLLGDLESADVARMDLARAQLAIPASL